MNWLVCYKEQAVSELWNVWIICTAGSRQLSSQLLLKRLGHTLAFKRSLKRKLQHVHQCPQKGKSKLERTRLNWDFSLAFFFLKKKQDVFTKFPCDLRRLCLYRRTRVTSGWWVLSFQQYWPRAGFTVINCTIQIPVITVTVSDSITGHCAVFCSRI